jgi:hypothetical protein
MFQIIVGAIMALLIDLELTRKSCRVDGHL